jgi:outer membrane protein assembly factor BamA
MRVAAFFCILHFAFCMARASAQAQGELVREVQILQEGQPVADRLILGLIETRAGAPLSMRAVRESIAHLMSLNRFEDVQVSSDPVPGGVRVRYVLVPRHPVDRLEFRGTLGLR